ncbi:MAG: 23S rRNA (adenine(2503)-C(2))-methyltransferase RlmN [Firmicutes bacterium]|nr:23S rRNA (adenine(2503)-C(2))-methyltransferase RlmN [Bacillota bacterium]
MTNIKSLTREERKALLKELGQPAYREKQIFRWISRGARSFDEMSDLPLSLRKALAENCSFESLGIAAVQSSSDGTRKYLLSLEDGNCVEAVFMRYEYGNSLCVSTQVGCAMGCAFCASTLGGKLRNLKAWEMLDEYLVICRDTQSPINHIVLMGIGEPFDNYEEVSAFLKAVHDPDGVNLSYRNITVSTCGIVPRIEAFGRDFPQVNLAISLHASSQSEREAIMPVAKAYGLDRLLEACRAHGKLTGRRVTFEYTLIDGKNDSLESAEALAKLLKGMLCHVNLIPLNPVAETGLKSSGRERAEQFRSYLEDHGVPATVRRRLGADIDAACGQLRKNTSTEVKR